jgi:hypothetical protein
MDSSNIQHIETIAAAWKATRDETVLWKRAHALSLGEQILLVACLIRDGFGHPDGQAFVLAKRLRLSLHHLGYLDSVTGRQFLTILGWQA